MRFYHGCLSGSTFDLRPPSIDLVAPSRTGESLHDVLVIGGGPAGAACAYWLAESGWDVVLVEKKRFPREKTCGDGLTPRSVRQLEDMGLGEALTGAHKYLGLRACAFGKVLEMRWPDHPSFPSHGYVITRNDLDQIVADRAAKAGAQVLQGCEALEPLLPYGPERNGPVRNGPVRSSASLPAISGARVKDAGSGTTREIKARYVVVADGSNSRFGRALGSTRDRRSPIGMALRGYYTSAAPRRPVHRVAPRSQRPFRCRGPGIRLDIPSGRRASERRGRVTDRRRAVEGT